MKRLIPVLIVMMSLFLPAGLNAQIWSGILSPARATDWSQVGIPGGIPSATWTQCGSTLSSASTAAIINAAILACPADTYVQLGAGDYTLNASVNLKTGVVLRGEGANNTRLHLANGASSACNPSTICIIGEIAYSGYCNAAIGTLWPCPAANWVTGYPYTANWTGGYAQGATTITLDSVTGIVLNQTPIIMDQCDVGFTGTLNIEACTAVDGVITSAIVYPGKGGTGYNVGDTGTIGPAFDVNEYYGGGAKYQVTSVSGGAVTGFSITNPGSGYTYTSTNIFGAPTTTTATSGSGSGFAVEITGVTGYDNGSIFPCAIPMICAELSGANAGRSARSQQEIFLATAISGTGPYTVTLNRPLQHPNWASSQGPQAWWPSATITNSGVEDLLVDESGVTTGASGVTIVSASKVWVKGVASNTANAFHVDASVCSNIVIRDSYFYLTTYQGVVSYGIGAAGAVGNSLYENNIIQGVVDPLNMDGSCSGCVFGYNFAVNNSDTDYVVLFSSSAFHATSTDFILTEGNVGAASNMDPIHGPHFMNTFYRNYFNGYEANCPMSGCNGVLLPYQATVPFEAFAFSRYNTAVANLVGTAGYHKYYQCSPASPLQQYCGLYGGTFPGWVHEWEFGFSASAALDSSNTPPLPNDLLTASSFMRWGNYDVVRNAVSWCGNSSDTGWASVCGSTSEIPTADPHFPNPIPTLGDTGAGQGGLPPSFYYTSRPSWLPPAFGWPLMGPDVTTGNILRCTSGAYNFSLVLSASQCAGGGATPAAVMAGHAIAIPAMYCYLNVMNGPPDGTGPILTFNADACYPLPPSTASATPH